MVTGQTQAPSVISEFIDFHESRGNSLSQEDRNLLLGVAPVSDRDLFADLRGGENRGSGVNASTVLP